MIFISVISKKRKEIKTLQSKLYMEAKSFTRIFGIHELRRLPVYNDLDSLIFWFQGIWEKHALLKENTQTLGQRNFEEVYH